MKSDFLVIGSGSAGLSFALKAAEHGTVTIVTKGELNECNTNYAQGGICSVTYLPDTFEKHIEDTLVCGAGKCDRQAVETVVRNAPAAIADLIAWGTRFNKGEDGQFDLHREGGHSEHRILHYQDLTAQLILYLHLELLFVAIEALLFLHKVHLLFYNQQQDPILYFSGVHNE